MSSPEECNMRFKSLLWKYIAHLVVPFKDVLRRIGQHVRRQISSGVLRLLQFLLILTRKYTDVVVSADFHLADCTQPAKPVPADEATHSLSVVPLTGFSSSISASTSTTPPKADDIHPFDRQERTIRIRPVGPGSVVENRGEYIEQRPYSQIENPISNRLMLMQGIVTPRPRRRSFPAIRLNDIQQNYLNLSERSQYNLTPLRNKADQAEAALKGSLFNSIFDTIDYNRITSDSGPSRFILDVMFVKKQATSLDNDIETVDILPALLDTGCSRSVISLEVASGLKDSGCGWMTEHIREECPACHGPIRWGFDNLTCEGIFRAAVFVQAVNGTLRPKIFEMQIVSEELSVGGPILSASELTSHRLLELVHLD